MLLLVSVKAWNWQEEQKDKKNPVEDNPSGTGSLAQEIDKNVEKKVCSSFLPAAAPGNFSISLGVR